MDLARSPGPDAVPLALTEVVLQLLRQGLECIQHGNCAEGTSLLEQAREQLAPQKIHLAPILEQVIKGCIVYCQAREVFFQARENFVRAEREQQALFDTFNKLLSTSEEAYGSGPYPQLHPGERSQPDQSSQESNLHQSLLSSRSPSDSLPGLNITCFGHFEVYRDRQPIELCPNRNGQAILRYLVAQSGYSSTADKLMGMLWPDDEQEVARHKVHVAVSALRSSLNKGYECEPGGGYILYKHQSYQINPTIPLKTDVEEFLSLYQAGRDARGQEQATLFERACRIYVGPFLVEDTYADWSFIRREQLSQAHLSMCHSLSDYFLNSGQYEETEKWANIVLEENRCDEIAHSQLVQAYAPQGHYSEALRQYRRCERTLDDELGISPTPETVRLFQAILAQRQVRNSPMKIERK